MVVAAFIGVIMQTLIFVSYSSTDSQDTNSDGDTKVNALKTAANIIFAVFLAFWASTFDQFWTRKEKIFAWVWGTTNFYQEEEQRGQFKGKMERDPVSNKLKRKKVVDFYHRLWSFLSFSIVLTFIVSAAGIISSILFLRHFIIKDKGDDTLGMITGGILNALQIRGMDLLYGKIAVYINDWQNYETETLYNNNLAVKVFIFKFVNSYTSLFYLAYADTSGESCGRGGCMDYLSIQLAIIFVISIILNVIEILAPWILMKRKVIQEQIHLNKMKERLPTLRENMYPIELQAKCESYESPVDDYIEMIIEFGYVILFGTALPILPLILLIEIIVEIRVDAWKICNICKRADPHRSEDIGVFKDIIVFIAYVGSINNAGLVVYTTGLFQNFLNPDENYKILLLFIVIEHVLLLGMFFISVIVPDDPEIVEKGLIWSERMVNERLYKTNETGIEKNYGDQARQKAKDDKAEFLLRENKIQYREEAHN